jgi:alpha-N-arabinofuranosidase
MKKSFLKILLLFLIQTAVHAQLTLSEEASKHYYQNPIISGFHPDPSICRVGDDYYLVTSTFEYFPGVPVYHSKDLVNWNLIGHVLNRSSQLDLENAGNSKGIFAPTIRYNAGVFYMITTYVKGTGNFICTATNPSGPWSEPHYIKDAPGIDPSLLFDDDGKVYYTGNRHSQPLAWEGDRSIWLQELDIKTWKLVGDKVDIVKASEYYQGLVLSGQEKFGLNAFEGPHVYKKDGYYYALVSHGGTSQNHAVSIWRSKNVYGPYEMNPNNPIVTHRDYPTDNEIHSTGHADIVQTQNNEWWMVLLATRTYGGHTVYNLGRESFLVPVDWSGTWPVVNPSGPKGRVQLTHRRPNLPIHKWPKQEVRDNFTSQDLNLNWNFIRTPKGNWWHIDKKLNQLQLNLIPNKITENKDNPAFIGRRQQHKNFTAMTKMAFTPDASNETAGLVILRDRDYQFRLVSTIENGKKVIQLIRRAMKLGGEEIIAQDEVESSSIYLKISALEQLYNFSYSVDGKDWKTLKANEDGRLLSRKWARGFTGTYIGMYASSNGKESKNKADFDWFEYSGY